MKGININNIYINFCAVVMLLIVGMIFVGCKKEPVQVFNYEINDSGEVVITGLTDNGKTYSTLSIPSEFEGKKVSTIGAEAFRNAQFLKKITIPEGVTLISENAFLGCVALDEIEFPGTIKNVGTNAFAQTPWEKKTLEGSNYIRVCDCLVKVKPNGNEYTVPDGIKNICSGVFYNNKDVVKVTLPESVEELGNYSFSGCDNLKEINIPKGIKEIGYGCFANSGIKEITIPTDATIDPDAFLGMDKVIYAGKAAGSPWGAKEHVK